MKKAKKVPEWVEPGKNDPAWIGVDLDGTLAHYEYGSFQSHVGEPIWPMVERIKVWLNKGIKVKIFTARWSVVSHREHTQLEVDDFLVRAGLPPIEITCVKDYHMVALYDDRAVAVEPNTGRLLSPEARYIL